MTFSKIFAFSLVGFTLVAAVACSEDEHSHSGTGACAEIIARCHVLDVGEAGPINDCHTLAHEKQDKDEAACEAKKDECLATCPLSSDGGAHDGH